ncbi:bifunctional DNA primase/polymerase [Kribbella sp. NPDC023972]|uniref:bifunctional DNA primase/polymerase n=1 Tax=Kribbella sp. NPDC023972 TaxID=3154795 RepID=UPI0033F1D128
MFKRSSRLLAAAQAYVDHGIAVMPGSPMVPDPETTSWRTSWRCSCGDRWCASPGMHPLTPAPIDTPSEVEALWRVPVPPNVLIASGAVVAVWRVPQTLGAYGMRRLEQQRPSVWPPVMRTPGGGWVFCTTPVGPGFTPAPDVELVTPDAPVLAPPSRGAGGVHRWLWSRTFPAAPLTSAEPVMAALTAARSDQLAVGS